MCFARMSQADLGSRGAQFLNRGDRPVLTFGTNASDIGKWVHVILGITDFLQGFHPGSGSWKGQRTVSLSQVRDELGTISIHHAINAKVRI